MIRLFLRFYIAVLCILVMAWLIQYFVFRLSNLSQNQQVVEQALAGGVRTAIAQLESVDAEGLESTLAALEVIYEYPVRRYAFADGLLRASWMNRIRDQQVVYYVRSGGGYVAAAMGEQHYVEFGPLPSFVGPESTIVTLGLGAVLLLAAIAIAILLRPVARQLHAVEKTAMAIAAGDLSARIDSLKVPKGVSLANAFNTMADRTENLLNSQRELLQAVSHELRTPLARMRFAVDLIESAPSDAIRSDRLAAVDRSIHELDELVGELLTYMRMDAPRPHAALEEFDLCKLVQEVIDSRSVPFPELKFSMVCQSAESMVVAERISVGRAIGNLVGNAAKFARGEIRVEIEAMESKVRIRVDDDGPGVPEDKAQQIFEPFVRLPGSPGSGAGLGLALVSRIVERHAGEVRATRSELGGACFEVLLPRSQ